MLISDNEDLLSHKNIHAADATSLLISTEDSEHTDFNTSLSDLAVSSNLNCIRKSPHVIPEDDSDIIRGLFSTSSRYL